VASGGSRLARGGRGQTKRPQPDSNPGPSRCKPRQQPTTPHRPLKNPNLSPTGWSGRPGCPVWSRSVGGLPPPVPPEERARGHHKNDAKTPKSNRPSRAPPPEELPFWPAARAPKKPPFSPSKCAPNPAQRPPQTPKRYNSMLLGFWAPPAPFSPEHLVRTLSGFLAAEFLGQKTGFWGPFRPRISSKRPPKWGAARGAKARNASETKPAAVSGRAPRHPQPHPTQVRPASGCAQFLGGVFSFAPSIWRATGASLHPIFSPFFAPPPGYLAPAVALRRPFTSFYLFIRTLWKAFFANCACNSPN